MLDPQLSALLAGPSEAAFPASVEAAAGLRGVAAELKEEREVNASAWKDKDGVTRVRRYDAGHSAFYEHAGRRFLFADPAGNVLHECEWQVDPAGAAKLVQARVRLDCQQWVGIRPEHKTFATDIDISSLPGWEKMTLDDLRRQAAQAWQAPFADVKYFYRDENFQPRGPGKYHIYLKKDALYALADGGFERALFISYMMRVDWARIDLIPVVELFQSALPGTGGAMFELIWGLYDDQNRQQPLPPLRYRGLPTYPAREAFNIFSAFFTPAGPPGEDVLSVFMDIQRSHEITWTPKPRPPWRHFSREHGVTLTVQDGILYKAVLWNDPDAVPFINGARGAPVCGRQARVSSGGIALTDGTSRRDIPSAPAWQIRPDAETGAALPVSPFDWRHFFGGNPPATNPVKMLFTMPLFPEGAEAVAEPSLQPLALDQALYYMELDHDMPDKLERAGHTLIHTFDAVIAGCIDSSRRRRYTVLYSDPELACKGAQLLWSHASARGELESLRDVVFLPETENAAAAYSQKYDLIFKWIPFMFYHDRENCENMLRDLSAALNPGGLLFLAAPRPISGLLDYYGFDCKRGDLVADMPFFRQHLKMCPENLINELLAVFHLEKRGA